MIVLKFLNTSTDGVRALLCRSDTLNTELAHLFDGLRLRAICDDKALVVTLGLDGVCNLLIGHSVPINLVEDENFLRLFIYQRTHKSSRVIGEAPVESVYLLIDRIVITVCFAPELVYVEVQLFPVVIDKALCNTPFSETFDAVAAGILFFHLIEYCDISAV